MIDLGLRLNIYSPNIGKNQKSEIDSIAPLSGNGRCALSSTVESSVDSVT